MAFAIEMQNIVKQFDGKTVLRDVNFQIERGEIFGLLGPSGSGKTTIINILTHQLVPESGQYRIDAQPMETDCMPASLPSRTLICSQVFTAQTRIMLKKR